jgi:hypothetical protein
MRRRPPSSRIDVNIVERLTNPKVLPSHPNVIALRRRRSSTDRCSRTYAARSLSGSRPWRSISCTPLLVEIKTKPRHRAVARPWQQSPFHAHSSNSRARHAGRNRRRILAVFLALTAIGQVRSSGKSKDCGDLSLASYDIQNRRKNLCRTRRSEVRPITVLWIYEGLYGVEKSPLNDC